VLRKQKKYLYLINDVCIYVYFQRDNTVRTVPSYITVGILVAGVVGGLVIVIVVILFCKFCVQKEKGLRRLDNIQNTSVGRVESFLMQSAMLYQNKCVVL